MSAQPPPRRCVYTKRNGERCKKSPILGGTVCHKHGGNAPQVRRKAAERMLALVDPALSTLDKSMKNEARCVNCSQPCGHLTDAKVAVRAAQVVLDRTGFGPQSKVEVDLADNAWLRFTTDQELETVTRIMESAKSRMNEVDSDDEDDDNVESVH